MKLLFVHDHKFKTSNYVDYYSAGTYPVQVWERYLSVFEEITVLGRNDSLNPYPEDSLSKFTYSSHAKVKFKLVPSASNFKSLIGIDKLQPELMDLVKSHDAIIVRLHSEVGHKIISFARKLGKPYAIELVECPWDSFWNYGGVKSKIYAPLCYIRTKHTLAQTPYALYVTKEFLQHRYPAPQATTTNCSNVEIPTTSTVILENRLKRINALGDNRIVLGQIASLTGKFKGIDTSIKALSRLIQEGYDVELRILGSGPKNYWINVAKHHNVSDKVFFDGSLGSGDPVFKWLDCIDIYVHPSKKEGLPRALLEAMSRSCPAVATSIAGIPELLSPNMLVKINDDYCLSNKIKELIGSKVLLESQAKENFEVSNLYVSEVLNSRRTDFWLNFRKFVSSRKLQ